MLSLLRQFRWRTRQAGPGYIGLELIYCFAYATDAFDIQVIYIIETNTAFVFHLRVDNVMAK